MTRDAASVTDWDAIVVGAGPAGSALACRLSPTRHVLLLERQPDALAYDPQATPRIGESLPGAARTLLTRFGLAERFDAEGHAERGASVSHWDLDAPAWFDPIRDPAGPGWHLDRLRFDAGLRAAAVESGAGLVDDCGRLSVAHVDDHWQVTLDATPSRAGRTYRAPVLVDASGRGVAVARQLGLRPREEDALVCLYLHLPVDIADEDQATRTSADDNGWWYSVRAANGRRVLAFHLDSDDPELKTLRDPAVFLAKARRQSLLAEVLPTALDTLRDTSHALTVHARPAGSAGLDPDALAATPEGFHAVGDALLAFDPIASQGLFNALATAESVATAIERRAAGMHDARDRHLDEVRAVHARYRTHLQATYAGVRRHAHRPFWARRVQA